VETVNVVAGIVFCTGFIPYALAILGRDVRFRKIEPAKPAKMSWIIWASLDSITLVGMYFKHTVNGQILGAVLGAWMIVALAVKFGTSGWTKLDKWCLSGAIIGIVLWKVSGEANFGIVMCNLIVFLASFPTFKSAWNNPANEDKLAWTIFWISCVLAVIAIPQWTLEDAMQPVTFFVVETIMMYILYRRIPLQHIVDSVCDRIAVNTTPFVQSRFGKAFLSLVLIGPFTFIPTIYEAWTAPNIDSLRTSTWPLMILINVSATMSLIHKGSWYMRLVQAMWVIACAAIYIATIVR